MRIILLGIALLLISCESDTEDITGCECNKVGEVRTLTYNSNGVIVNDTGYYENGYNEYYSNNCDDDGLIVDSSTGQFPNTVTEIRYKIKCN